MRKLLLLLPVLALASCSGGHDLMSNKPFQIKCERIEDITGGLVNKPFEMNAYIDPESQQSVVQMPDTGFSEEVPFALNVLPNKFILILDNAVIAINRKSGNVTGGINPIGTSFLRTHDYTECKISTP